VRRTLEQAFQALNDQVKAWASGQARPDLRVFVYPPEWESLVLDRLPSFATESEAAGRPIQLEDVGQGFLAELKRRKGLVQRLEQMDQDQVLHDLEQIASRYLEHALTRPLDEPAVCRVIMNTGSIGTFVSYSAIANKLAGSDGDVPATLLAFPGEADDRSLNLLRLRVDTNYRVPRV
jgi:hypothetical protein